MCGALLPANHTTSPFHVGAVVDEHSIGRGAITDQYALECVGCVLDGIHNWYSIYVLNPYMYMGKSECLGFVALLCLVVCLTLLASFFLHSGTLQL